MAVPLDARLSPENTAGVSAPGALPPEAPLSMPVQDLAARPPRRRRRMQPLTWLARLAVFGGAGALTVWGVREMALAVQPGGLTGFEVAFLVLFACAFGWIAQSACAALIGVLYRPSRVRPVRSAAPAALVMPIYNEDANRTAAALQAMAEDLIAEGGAAGFEIFILSDSTDPDVWLAEAVAAERLRAAIGRRIPVWYRRRTENSGRKAGNVKEFVSRWGARYDFMIVLDADSMMSGAAIAALRDAIDTDPDLALLQSTPVLAGRRSLFARLQQFAGWMHGPVAARGVAVWSGDDGNFWGHNAVIRTEAFARCCGLPELRGPRPIGGAILSHDFVEAALLRRCGWKVRMAPELEGSWEEAPPSLLDAAARDRRWAQGNLQHLGVIAAERLSPFSRMHMAIGVMSYLASPLWLALIGVGMVLSIQARLFEPDYFPSPFELFPNWPRFDSERMLELFLLSMAVLLTPKIIGLVRALLLTRLRRAAGGAPALIASWITEIVLSALYAPVMLLIQCQQLAEILIGRDSGWNAQQREEKALAWAVVWRRHAGHMAAGALAAIGALAISPAIFLWLTPTLAGMVLAAPLSRLSASRAVGSALLGEGLLAIPDERRPPAIFARRDALLAAAPALPAADPLRAIASDHELRAVYLGWFAPRPAPPRGRIDPDRLAAAKKIEEAGGLAEALAWLDRAERRAVLGEPRLIAALSRLPR